MKTTELEGALLDYHTARAEGVPAADLELRANGTLCVRRLRNGPDGIDGVMALDYSTNWALTGPLRDKYKIELLKAGDGWCVPHWERGQFARNTAYGATAMIAICRAVVRAAFGDDVEDLKC